MMYPVQQSSTQDQKIIEQLYRQARDILSKKLVISCPDHINTLSFQEPNLPYAGDIEG